MKKKGFTLIELLAVIVILGILMLVAIPSVTAYINNTRKEGYIDTAKNILKGAVNLVNSGELDMYDTDTTYYIPSTCINLETGGDSPYGKFDPAYIVVTYDNESYDYYWISRDTQGMGIKNITNSNDLKSSLIESGIKKTDVQANTGISGRNSIIEFNSDCSDASEPRVPEHNVNTINYFPNQSTGTLMVQPSGSSGVFGYNSLSRYRVKKIYTVQNKDIPANAIHSWDVSVERDGSVMAWYTDVDNDTYYELYIGQNGGVKANPNSSYLFSLFTQAIYLDLSNLNTSNVTDMSYMFYQTGYNFDSTTPFRIIGLNKFDTSKVTTMKYMFEYAGRSSKDWNIGDISSWDTGNVRDFSGLFYFSAYNTNTFNIGNIGKWNVSNAEDMSRMFTAGGEYAKNWYIGDLSNWDTRKVTNMESMFLYAGQDAQNFNIGTLKIYANNISDILNIVYYAHATLNIYSNPTQFSSAIGVGATYGGEIVVNYSRNTTNIDAIIATKNASSNARKGIQLD